MRISETVPFYQKKAINGGQAGNEVLGNTPEEVFTIPVSVTVHAESIINFISSSLQISVGTNAPDFDNILQLTSLVTAITETRDYLTIPCEEGKSISGTITVKKVGNINCTTGELSINVRTKQI